MKPWASAPEQEKFLDGKSRCEARICWRCSGAEHCSESRVRIPEQVKFLGEESRCEAKTCLKCSGAEHCSESQAEEIPGPGGQV